MIGRFQVTVCATLTMALVALSAGSSAADEPWAQVLGQSGYWYIHSVQQTGDGGYVLAGYAEPKSTDNRDAWLVKPSPTGSVLWHRTFGRGEHDYLEEVIETAGGSIILAGEAWNENSGTTRGLIVRIPTDGTVCDGLGRHTGAATKESAATPAITSAAAQATGAKAKQVPSQVGPSAAVSEDLCSTELPAFPW